MCINNKISFFCYSNLIKDLRSIKAKTKWKNTLVESLAYCSHRINDLPEVYIPIHLLLSHVYDFSCLNLLTYIYIHTYISALSEELRIFILIFQSVFIEKVFNFIAFCENNSSCKLIWVSEWEKEIYYLASMTDFFFF